MRVFPVSRPFLSQPARLPRRRGLTAGGLAGGILALTLALLTAGEARAQYGSLPGASTSTAPTQPQQQQRGGFFLFRQPQRTVTEIVPRQAPANISARLMDQATPDNTRVIVSLSKQRVYLMLADEVALDSPISSGRKGHSTPTGSFNIKEKELNHFSNIYGNFVDRNGRVVRSGVSSRIDSAPSGTSFSGAPMKYFMRLTDGGVGMHIGILPGYAASHGCVRLPADIAPLIYSKVKTGTSVRVED